MALIGRELASKTRRRRARDQEFVSLNFTFQSIAFRYRRMRQLY
jgi:hypothetical protein